MGDGGVLVMDVERATIREILAKLAKRYGGKFRDDIFEPHTNNVLPQNQILVNGRHYRYLIKGLDTELKNGDELSLFPPVAGG